MTRFLLRLAALLVFPFTSGAAQQAVHHGWPNVNRPLQVAPGETVVLLNRILVDRSPGVRLLPRLDFQISTTIPAADVAAREAQALRVVQALAEDARTTRARQVSVAICDTDACAEHREPPKVWYLFEPGPRGVWQRMRN